MDEEAESNIPYSSAQFFGAGEYDHESAVLEAEKETILANESQILYAIETSKFDPKIYSNFQLGSNSATLDISSGQWV